jgi:cytochrome c-type biogenesis protein CcmF
MYFSDVGTLALLIALVAAIWAGGTAVTGVYFGRSELLISSRRGVYLATALVSLASSALVLSFLTHDFGLRYVAERSNRAMPLYYVAAAFYGGQEGSLLFWSLGLAIFTALAVATQHRKYPALMPFVIVTLIIIQVFFLAVLIFASSPFTRLNFTPADGLGLNPILRDWGMLVHPPMLLLGYMSTALPLAFGIAALITGRFSNEWLQASRRWILTSWLLLSAGNLLGSWWAYHVLGWGGYWGWDPVENTAFMPWLAVSALLHSMLIQERRGMLKIWNMSLLILSFGLSIFGTFLVRSGVIASVHSFSLSSIGPLFFFFLGFCLVVPLGLLIWRLPLLKSDRTMDALISREASFLFNNLLLITIAIVTFWGTVFPLVSEAVTGNKITVGKPFYEQTNGPLFLMLLILMGLGPLIPWRKATHDILLRNLLKPVAAGGVTITILFMLGLREIAALLAFGVCGFVVASVIVEFYRGAKVRRMQTSENWLVTVIKITWRTPTRYAGYLVHLGIIFMAVGVISSSFYKSEQQVVLKPGESTQFGVYTVTYTGPLEKTDTDNTQIVQTPLQIQRAGDSKVDIIYPEKRVYAGFENQPTTGVAIHTTLQEDLYVVFNSIGSDKAVGFYLFINPMVSWLWIGGLVVLLGGLISWYPRLLRQPGFRRATVTKNAGLEAGD